MGLFQLGDFVLNSGAKSAWKLECDAITNDDILALAEMVRQLVGPFASVRGVPRGGLRLASALEAHVTRGHRPGESRPWPHLIVDDVLTNGGSMERARSNVPEYDDPRLVSNGGVIGAVIFARGQCPHWVKALFQMPECFWLEPVVR